ncbi:PilZ domain-containing protein [Desulfonatronovibrio magnus]|uniref:PilZ domain-containing protein n=1 Tax=Desulfonatronovibrio magnus TaxID=698827 RepID=UPI0005EAE191|nr:PilZ domain-containing protein [Desulfonatronovibrio magnus]
MDMFNDQLQIDYESSSPRKAYRVAVPNLKAKIKNMPEEFPALDISAGGMALSLSHMKEHGLEEGLEVELSILIKNRVFLDEIKGKIVKIDDNMAACQFSEITLRQEARLDKLILEVQKKMLEFHRKKKENETKQET